MEPELLDTPAADRGPIFGVAQLYTLWVGLDKTFVLGYRGDEGLGLYTVAFMAGQAFEILPIAISQVIYPRMAEQYGRTEKLADLIPMTVKPILLSVLAMLPMVAVGWWLMPRVVAILLPKYVEGVPAMQWSLLPALLTCFGPVNSVFIVVRRQDLYAVAMLLGMGAYVASMLWLVRGGAVLAAFPQAMFLGRIVFIAACYAFIFYLSRREAARADA